MQLITVGIGITHSYDKMELEGIASDPDEKTLFYTKNFTTLVFQNNIADNIVRAICSGENLLVHGFPSGFSMARGLSLEKLIRKYK